MRRATCRTRAIVVEQHRLRWRIEWLTTDPINIGPIMQIVVFSLRGGGPRLLACQRTEDTFLPLTEAHISPRYVEAIIRLALAEGWAPESRGPDFRLDGFAAAIERIW